MRELSMPCTLRLWDTYVADKSFASFHVYVCAAVLLHFSRQLQAMDFQEMIFFLQKMPTDEWQPEQMEVRPSLHLQWVGQESSPLTRTHPHPRNPNRYAHEPALALSWTRQQICLHAMACAWPRLSLPTSAALSLTC